jgi:hypothetical protein
MQVFTFSPHLIHLFVTTFLTLNNFLFLIEKSNDMIENRTRDLQSCNIVPQTTPLQGDPIREVTQQITSPNVAFKWLAPLWRIFWMSLSLSLSLSLTANFYATPTLGRDCSFNIVSESLVSNRRTIPLSTECAKMLSSLKL